MEQKIKELELRIKALETSVITNGIYLRKNQFNDEPIDYKIGDKVASIHNPDSIIGTCTGFTHDDSCILIDGNCWGGKYYFTKK